MHNVYYFGCIYNVHVNVSMNLKFVLSVKPPVGLIYGPNTLSPNDLTGKSGKTFRFTNPILWGSS